MKESLSDVKLVKMAIISKIAENDKFFLIIIKENQDSDLKIVTSNWQTTKRPKISSGILQYFDYWDPIPIARLPLFSKATNGPDIHQWNYAKIHTLKMSKQMILPLIM